MEMVNTPMILSHSTSTMFASTRAEDQDFLKGKVPRPRLEIPRDKEMLEAIVGNNGVLGMIWILYKNINEAVDDIETAFDTLGPDHVGMGSDLYGEEMATPGLEDISKVPSLVAELVN